MVTTASQTLERTGHTDGFHLHDVQLKGLHLALLLPPVTAATGYCCHRLLLPPVTAATGYCCHRLLLPPVTAATSLHLALLLPPVTFPRSMPHSPSRETLCPQSYIGRPYVPSRILGDPMLPGHPVISYFSACS